MTRFKTVYADPPWKFSNRATRSAAEKSYRVMTVEEIMNLGPLVEGVSEDNAHLYLWSTVTHMPDAFKVMAEWGYVYKMFIPWIKLTKHGKLHFGMGNYFRPCLEPCLFGVRGRMRTLTRNTRNILYARRPPMHSAKPPEMYDLIEKNSPEPRLELFSRSAREGWTMIGEEIDGQDIEESLRLLGGAYRG